MVQPVSTITLGELTTFVKRQFGDESGVQIIDSDIARWVNMGAMEIVAKNRVLQATATTPGIIGTGVYDLTLIMPDVISIEDVSYGGYTLEPTDNSGIKKLLGTASTDTGRPLFWYIWANNLKFWPVPTTAETISIDYIKRPSIVSIASDLLPLPDVYWERLCNFVLSKAYELDEDVPNSSNQRRLFEDKLTEMTGIQSSMAGSFPVVREDFAGGYYLANSAYGEE